MSLINGTNSNTFEIYHTTDSNTAPANYERFEIRSTGSVWQFRTVDGGTGGAQSLGFVYSGATKLNIGNDLITYADLRPNVTATYDIGTDALRYKNLYLGGETVTASTPVLSLSQTVNEAATTFEIIDIDVTNTASAAVDLLTVSGFTGASFGIRLDDGPGTGTIWFGGNSYADFRTRGNRLRFFGGASNISSGTNDVSFLTNDSAIIISSDWGFSWSDGVGNTANGQEFGFRRHGAHFTGQIGSTNAQKMAWYNTGDTNNSPTDWERGFASWQETANIFTIGTEAGGTGTVQNMALDAPVVLFPSNSNLGDTSGNNIGNIYADNLYNASGGGRLQLGSADFIFYQNIRLGAAGDFFQTSSAAYLGGNVTGTWDMLRTTQSQALRIWHTTDTNTSGSAVNYERLAISSDGSNWAITAEKGGTGGNQGINYDAPVIQRFLINGSGVMTIQGSSVYPASATPTLGRSGNEWPQAFLGGETVTASTPVLDLSQTWNNGAVAFTGALMNITNTASDAASKLLNVQVDGNDRFRFDSNGEFRILNSAGTESVTVRLNGTAAQFLSNDNFANINLGSRNSIYATFDDTYAAVSDSIQISTSGSVVGQGTIQLHGIADDQLDLRRGTNAQTYRVFNTYDGTNDEWGYMQWDTNVLEFGMTNTGTGSAREVRYGGVNTNSRIQFETDSDVKIFRGGTEKVRWLSGGHTTLLSLLQKSVEATITASTTQTQGQQPLTLEINEVSTVANANDVVTLVDAAAGLEQTIINNGANTLQIFPASGDDLGAGLNTSTTLSAGGIAKFVAYDATNWVQLV